MLYFIKFSMTSEISLKLDKQVKKEIFHVGREIFHDYI